MPTIDAALAGSGDVQAFRIFHDNQAVLELVWHSARDGNGPNGALNTPTWPLVGHPATLNHPPRNMLQRTRQPAPGSDDEPRGPGGCPRSARRAWLQGERAAVVVVLGVMLLGCGGGGGGDESGTTPPPRTYVISGTLSGLAGNRSITLQNNGADDQVLSANGSFSFGTRVPEGGPYAVRVAVQPQGQECRVERSTGSALANVNDVVVVCSNVPAATYRIGGTVSGLLGNGSILGLRNNQLDFLEIAVDGDFRFNVPVAAGEPYAVVVQTLPAGQRCTVSDGVGIATADVSNVSVLCAAASAAPAGGVQGMAGTWLNGACVPHASGQSTKKLLRVTRQSDLSVAVSESTASYANASCSGSFTPGAFAPASLVTVRRTESTETTTATWAHWEPASGIVYSSLWHWRRDELCLKEGNIADSSNLEALLPTAASVEAYFSSISASNAACFLRQ